MIKGVVERLPELPDEVFVSARQENLETIHQHNVIADASARSAKSAPSCHRRAGAGAHEPPSLARLGPLTASLVLLVR